eukprot:1485158-Rhodomonas_salina.1
MMMNHTISWWAVWNGPGRCCRRGALRASGRAVARGARCQGRQGRDDECLFGFDRRAQGRGPLRTA